MLLFNKKRGGILNKNLKAIYLPSILFLTLSNLTLLIPIYMSFKRQLFVESFIFILTMFFSMVSFFPTVLLPNLERLRHRTAYCSTILHRT